MAVQLQTLTNEEQVKLILKTEDKTKLTPGQLTWITKVLFPTLQQAFGEEKVKDANQALILVKQNPEIVLSIFSKEKDTGTQVQGAVVANLVRDMNQDKAKLAETLNTVYTNLPQKERENIKFIIATLQNQKLQETIAINQKVQADLQQAKQEINPKSSNNLANTEKLSKTLIEAINEGEKLNLPKEKLKEVEEKLVQTLIANPKQAYQDNPSPIKQEELIILALTTIATNTDPEVLTNNPIVETARALNQGFRPITPEDYQQMMAHDLHQEGKKVSTPNHIYDIKNNQVLILPSPQELSTETEVRRSIEKIVQNSAPFLNTEPGKDTLDNTNLEVKTLTKNAQNSPKILDASETIISPITKEQFQTVIRIVNTANSKALTHAKPNPDASKAIAILEETGNPEDKNLAAAVELASMGLTSQQIQHMVIIAQQQTNEGKDTAVTRLVNSNPEVVKVMTILGLKIEEIEATTPPIQELGQRPTPSFHQEIYQGKSNRFRDFFQPIYNKFSSRLPVAISKPLNVIFHPIDSLKSWFGRRAGKAIAKRLGKTVVGKAAGALLKNGVKQGVKWLIKQGIKGAAQLAAQALNVIPGLGLLAGVIVEVGAFIGDKILKPLAKFALAPLLGIVTDIFGKPNLKEDIPAAFASIGVGLGSALGAIPTVLATASSAAFAATTAVGTTIIIASGITLVFYLAAFNMGPVIASLAQLGMPITGGMGSGVGGGTYIKDPNATYNDTIPNAGTSSNKTECVTFSDSPHKWSDDQKKTIRGIISQLPSWLYICNGNNVELIYGGNKGSQGGLVQGNTVTIYDAGFNIYTLTHEIGHIYANNNEAILQKFISSGIYNSSEGYVHTYPLEKSPSEDFAEMIAIYHTNPSMLASRYPLHYKFMQDNIIK
jgi:hypothetical protein